MQGTTFVQKGQFQTVNPTDKTVLSTMKSAVLFFLTLCCGLVLSAQPYNQIESNNIRINPEWVKTMQSGDFCWAMDVALDAESNSYSTGYFQKSLSDSGFTIEQNCKWSRCEDELFLTKRDSLGNPIWIMHATGHLRPSRIHMEQDGNVLLTGFLMGDTMVMTQADGSHHRLARGQQTGIFLLRISNTGQVLKSIFLSQNEETVNDLAVDAKGNIYLTGEERFRRAHKPSYVQSRLLVMKLNKNWKLTWRKVADSLGTSGGNTLAIVGSTLYVGGSYSDTISFGKAMLTTPRHDQKPLLFALNKRGKLKWISDSVSSRSSQVISTMAADSKGHIYVFGGSSYSYASLSKISKDGTIIWSRNINGRATVYSNRLLINKKDELYLCGEGYGAVFQSTQPELLSFKSVGSTDPFLASYASDGSLRWLKVYGGKGTDYCKSIAVSDSFLHAFGWTNQPFRFYSMVTKGKAGYLFYEAKFKLSALEHWDRTVNKPFVEETEKWPKISALDCGCETEPLPKLGYAASLSGLLDVNEFKGASGWKIEPHDSVFKFLFFTGLQNSSSYRSSFYSLNLISFKPIQLRHPKSAYTLEINPCSNQAKHRSTQATFHVDFTIRGYDNSFNVANFDSSLLSYIQGLYTLAQTDEQTWLGTLIFNSNYYAYPENQKRIKQLFQIDLDSSEDEETVIIALSEALESKNISLSRFTANFLMNRQVTKHKVTQEEKIKLEQFMRALGSFRSIDEINDALHPSYRLYMNKTPIGVRFEPAILHQWNGVSSKAVQDSMGQLLAAYALVEADELEFSNKKGVDLKFTGICFKRSEIGSTGVLMDIRKFIFINERNKLNNFNYPLFYRSDFVPDNNPYRRPEFTQELLDFQGTLVTDAFIQLPFAGQYVPAYGEGIALNGQFITGHFDFEALPKDTADNGAINYAFKLGDSERRMTEAELKAHFIGLGFNDIAITYTEYKKQLNIHFVYRKPN